MESQTWTTWLNGASHLSAYPDKMKVTFINYGHFANLNRAYGAAAEPLKFNSIPLFTVLMQMYQNANPNEKYDKGASLHLFGTPEFCTPTMVFGKVYRRYLRAFALYFPDISKVYPLRIIWPKETWFDASQGTGFFTNELEPWLSRKSADYQDTPLAQAIGDTLGTDLPHTIFWNGDLGTSRSPLRPVLEENSPYVDGLCNLRHPKEPTKSFDSCYPLIAGNYGNTTQLSTKDLMLRQGGPLHLTTGVGIDQFSLDAQYFAARTSYLIDEPKVKLSDQVKPGGFLNQVRVLAPTQRNNCYPMYLNQVIRIKGDLEIDIPIEVHKGGIIICDGKIKITQKIVNPYICPSPPTDPDHFGVLTLVSRKGIEIGALPTTSGSQFAELHAFLVAMTPSQDGKIEVNSKLHIKGGIAVDRLHEPSGRNLVEQGGIVEWGFDPQELDGDQDYQQKSFYGLAIGPRDAEIVDES